MIKIYNLTHPSSKKIYIGKTCRDLNKRLYGHLNEAKNNPFLKKNQWITNLIKKGLQPNINLIEEVPDKMGNEKEKHHIALGWKLFPNDMLNSPKFNQYQLAENYDLAQSTIWSILKNKIWHNT